VTTGSQGFERFFGWLGEKLTILTDEGMEVSWVVGKHREDQMSELNSQGSPIAYVADTQLTERFTDSSVVLTRFGVTAFELTARGVPTLILPGWAAAEADEVHELARAGVVLVATSVDQVPQLAHQLASDRNLQMRLSEKARDYFKTESPHPAAKLVSQLVSRSS
jgi:UDP-N-acetylglucosamine:LPS N-acetylglucosamine transferase